MKIERLPNDMLAVVDANNGLKVYLNNLLKGRDRTPRSWLYEHESDTEVLRKWLTQLEQVKSTPHGDLVFQFDTSQLKKWGPQGQIAPIKELMDVVTEGFARAASPQPTPFRSDLWQQAKRNVSARMCNATGYRALTPRSYPKVLDDMSARDTLESNSGWPLFTRRKNPDVIRHALDAITSGAWREYPAIALFRNYNQKTRIVWMYPLATNIVEGSFTQPLKEALMHRGSHFYNPWRGYELVKQEISFLYEAGRSLTASDFSHTDAYFLKWQMLEVYDVIKNCFQEQYHPLLKESMLRVCSIPLIIGPDTYITGDHGVSSGSNWTNDCETYMDEIAEEYLKLLGVVDDIGMAIGDDVLHQRRSFDPKLADTLAGVYKSLGFDVNAEKVTNQQDYVKFLQRLTVRGLYSQNSNGSGIPCLRGIYPTVRALNSLLNPERFHSPKLWSKDMFAVRCFMILENCVDHPLFEDFVRFVCAGHPYLSVFARKTRFEVDSAQGS
uniref:Putative RNA-dependent RNA polymerase n=1 Tax=Dromedary picobirnavirus TaxID=1574421 RepID=A0A0A1EKY8_9VIRU|nr:putative RNA-dependent RNA polymerase [Dromedary picobirnavirus]